MPNNVMRCAVLAGLLAVASVPVMANEASKPDAKVKISVVSLVAARQAAMMMSAADLGAIRAMYDAGDAPDKMRFAVNGLVRWSMAMTGLFAKGSAHASSRALPAIWTNWPGFEAEAAKFQGATGALQAAVKGTDRAAIGTAIDGVRASCQSCHTRFQAPPPPAPKPAG